MGSTKDVSANKKRPQLRKVGTMLAPFKKRSSIKPNKLFKCRTFVRKNLDTTQERSKGSKRKIDNLFFIKSHRSSRKETKIGRLMFKKINREENDKLKNQFNDLIKSAADIDSEIVKQLQLERKEEEKIVDMKKNRKIVKIKRKKL